MGPRELLLFTEPDQRRADVETHPEATLMELAIRADETMGYVVDADTGEVLYDAGKLGPNGEPYMVGWVHATLFPEGER